MLISPHFTLEELTHTDHREFDNTPNANEVANLRRLAALLEQVKQAVGWLPVIVNSAFRSKQVNDSVGSKDTSQHRLGCAADIRVPGMTPDQVVRAIIASDIEFDQVIREFDRWVHISIPNTPDTLARGSALIIDKTGTRKYS